MSTSTNAYSPSADKKGFPAISELTDATISSFAWIACSLFMILLGWKSHELGESCGKDVVEYVNVVDEKTGKKRKVAQVAENYEPRRINIFWVLKVLTVLFHELSHAFVGYMTGGIVGYISVNAHEGGETYFKPSPPPPARQRDPWPLPTLAAGYLGSCLIGCGLLGAGFDALASKYAAVALIAYLGAAACICMTVRWKFAVAHHWEWLSLRATVRFGRPTEDTHARLMELKIVNAKMKKGGSLLAEREAKLYKMKEELGLLKHKLDAAQRGEQRERAGKIQQQMTDKERKIGKKEANIDEVYLEKMVSLDIIGLVGAFITFVCILPTWLYADSFYLRFVIMFIGLFSAVYAVQDIYDDGVRNHKAGGSDAYVYAEILLDDVPEEPEMPHKPTSGTKKALDRWGRVVREYDGEMDKYHEDMGAYTQQLSRKTKHLAWYSLIAQLFAILFTILTAVYLVQTTTAEQALRSRSFLPSPWHLQSADLLEKAREGGQSVQDWGKKLLGDESSGS